MSDPVSTTLPGFTVSETIILAAVGYHTADGVTDWDKVMEHLGSKSIASVKERLRLAKKRVYQSATDENTTATVDGEKLGAKTMTPRKRTGPKRKADVEGDGEGEGDNEVCPDTPSKKVRKTPAPNTKAARTDADAGNDVQNGTEEGTIEVIATPAKKARKPRTPKSKVKVEDSDGNENEEEGTVTPAKKPRAKAAAKPKATGAKTGKGAKKGSEKAGDEKDVAADNAETPVKLKKEESPDSALAADLLDAQLNCDADEGRDPEDKATASLAGSEQESKVQVAVSEI